MDLSYGKWSLPIPRSRVINHIDMGRKIVEWVTEPDTKPKNIKELREQLDGIAIVPEEVVEFSFSQNEVTRLVIRLPAPEMLKESYEEMEKATTLDSYPIPQFYYDVIQPGLKPRLTALEALLSRMGDYSISQCKN